MQASAWPVLNSSLLMMGLSWTCCCGLQFAFGLHRLALCTAMHSVVRIMLAYAGMCATCPMPPVFMPGAVASGMGMLVGVVLLCISHFLVHAPLDLFDTEEFYMNHAWAYLFVLLAMRHTVFRAATWLLMLACS